MILKSKMKIGIDVRTLSYRLGGISQYLRNILKALQHIDTANSYFLYNYNKKWDYSFISSSNFKIRTLRVPHSWYFTTVLWQEIILPLGLLIDGIDIFLGFDFFVPKKRNRKQIVVIYDTIFLSSPEFTINANYVSMMKQRVIKSIKYSDKIITISNFSKNEIMKHFKVDENKITVVYPGVDEKYFTFQREEYIRKKYNLPEKYILFVGELSYRKNIVRLIDAFNIIKDSIKCNLVLVGKLTTSSQEIFHKIKEYQISHRINYLGYIPDDDLPYIYKMADAFIFPSLYEGFGMPLLEAMSSRVPVICSNRTAIPEVGADTVFYIDPENIQDIANKIIYVTKNALEVKNKIDKAYNRAKSFSWYRAAKSILEIINNL